MKLTDLSVDRPILSMMFFVALIVLGLVSYSKMSLDLFPDIDFPIAAVILEYKGVGPKEIESTVSRPIEEALASINNIEDITSVSKEGSSMVIVKYVWGTDMSLAVSDMREKIDIVKRFLPEDIETPIVMKFDLSMMPILMLSISGKNKTSAELREYAEDELKSMIERVDGVASAGVMGGEKPEVKVELIKNRMDAYGLTIDSIINILRMENLDVAGGEIKSYYKQFTLRTMGEFKSLNDIRN
ncbi:MAG: efflux RND transporter permease subunit, partial [Spirochaetes bacterium]|nr:efflux RND transporter permease subunit [Spirochaetota bacterium]